MSRLDLGHQLEWKLPAGKDSVLATCSCGNWRFYGTNEHVPKQVEDAWKVHVFDAATLRGVVTQRFAVATDLSESSFAYALLKIRNLTDTPGDGFILVISPWNEIVAGRLKRDRLTTVDFDIVVLPPETGLKQCAWALCLPNHHIVWSDGA